MKIKFCFALMLSVVFQGQLQAEQQVIGDDGRQIILAEDGTWSYSSTDRFATTANGKRVRLKEDGSWEFTGEKASLVDRELATQKLAAKQSVDVVVSKLVIESSRKNLPAQIKSKNTQSVFYLNLKRQQSDDNQSPLVLQASDFKVIDSDDNEYKVVRINPVKAILGPGDDIQIELRVSGSPKWWQAKTMTVVINKKALASPVDINVSSRLNKAEKINVKSFQ
jgi:hypothetical protein